MRLWEVVRALVAIYTAALNLTVELTASRFYHRRSTEAFSSDSALVGQIAHHSTGRGRGLHASLKLDACTLCRVSDTTVGGDREGRR